MHNEFMTVTVKELYVELSDGRTMQLKDLIKDYESLWNEKKSKSQLKVGEWFRIDRDVINQRKEEIRCKCNEAGPEAIALWERFEASNKIADENPDEYPRLIETYIFKHNWAYKTEQEMRDLCELVGDGMCCEVICDLELQMRICNGTPVYDLVNKADTLPNVRVIRLRDGGTGFVGGGVKHSDFTRPPFIELNTFNPNQRRAYSTPYAFRRVTSES